MPDQAQGLMKEPKIINVVSGKGGVGKSVIAVNLSIVLGERGKKVLLFDSDIGFGSVEILLGSNSKKTLKDYFRKSASLEEIVLKTDYGIDMLSSGLDVEDLVYFNVGDKTQLYRDFVNVMGRYDYVVLDFPPGYNENLENFYEASDFLIVITTPEPTSLINTYTFVKVMVVKGVDPKEIHIVMNMVRDLKEGRRTLDKLVGVIERFIGVSITATHIVRMDQIVKKSVFHQKPFVRLKKTAQPSLAVHRIASMILREEGKEKVSFFERIKAFLGIG